MNGESALNMLTGAALSTAGNIASAKLDFEQTRELMDLQRQWSVLSWNRQNEHNEAMYNKYASPSAMVRQYKEAGLNPAALAGSQPGQSLSNSSSAETPSPGYSGKYDLGGSAISGAQLALSIARQEAEIDNIEANTKNVESQTNERDTLLDANKRLLDAKGISQSIRNDIDSITYNVVRATETDNINEIRSSALEAAERVDSLRYENTKREFENSKMLDNYELWRSEYMLKQAELSAKILAIDAGIEVDNSTLLNMAKDREFLNEQIKSVKADTDYKMVLKNIASIEEEFARENKWWYFVMSGAEGARAVGEAYKAFNAKKNPMPMKTGK